MFSMGPAFFRSAPSYATLALTGTFAAATVGAAYSSSILITGGLEPYSLTGGTGVASGSLDTGFALSITGGPGAYFLTLACASPATADTMTFTASVDSTDVQTATSAQSVVVNPAAATTYNGVIAAASPALWWKLDEVTGTTAADSTTGTAHSGSLTGGAAFSDSGVSIPAPTGYAGLGRGVDFSAASVTDVQRLTTGIAWGAGSWSLVMWVAGSAGASQYLASRVNAAAVIYQFVTDKVEFFSGSFSGSDPRPGSQISLPASDTVTPHLVVYRYDDTAGTWSGWMDNVEVFHVTRAFSCDPADFHYLGSDSTTHVTNSRVWDHQLYTRYLSDSEIGAMWDARDVP